MLRQLEILGAICFCLCLFSHVVEAQDDVIRRIIQTLDQRDEQIRAMKIIYDYAIDSPQGKYRFDNNVWICDATRTRSIYKMKTLVDFSEEESKEYDFVDIVKDALQDGSNISVYEAPIEGYADVRSLTLCEFRESIKKGYDGNIYRGRAGRFDPLVMYASPFPYYWHLCFNTHNLKLQDFLREFTPTQIKEWQDEQGDELVQLDFVEERPIVDAKTPGAVQMTVNLSKGATIASFSTRRETQLENEKIVIATVWNARDLREIAPNVWFPYQIDILNHNGDEAKGSRQTRFIKEIAVNHVSASEFSNFAFPEGAFVHENNVEDELDVIHIWGRKNKPEKTFQTLSDLVGYVAEVCGLEIKGVTPQPYVRENPAKRYVLLFLGLVLILLSFCINGKRRKTA